MLLLTPHRSLFSALWRCIFVCMLSASLFACQGKKKPTGAYCKGDSDCAEGWICEASYCAQGERDQKEVLARKKAKQEAKEKRRKEREIKKRQTKPGEGRVTFRICPFFKNTSDSVGSIGLIHLETKKREIMSLQMEVTKDSMQSEFTFYSIPLGKYEVYATYGVESNGRFDTHRLKCDPKVTTRPCKNDELRIVEVVLPENDVKKIRPDCDWIAE